jgi:ATP synthase protein I
MSPVAPDREPPRRRPPSTAHTLGSIGSVGLAFVIAVGIGFWVGRSVDTWLDTSPWFTFLFFFAGVAAGALNVFRTVGRGTGTGPANDDRGRT